MPWEQANYNGIKCQQYRKPSIERHLKNNNQNLKYHTISEPYTLRDHRISPVKEVLIL